MSYNNELILLQNSHTQLNAGMLLPPQYHLTLWAYLVGRSDRGHSPVWN